MSAKYYTLAELQQLALDSANIMGLQVTYTNTDSDKAYNHAVGFCGFENPLSSDADYLARQFWLLEGMKLYFWKNALQRYLLKFDVGDLKLSQVNKTLRELIFGSEDAFTKVKENPNTAYLFMNASKHFGQVVYKSGITDDAIGQSVNPGDLRVNTNEAK